MSEEHKVFILFVEQDATGCDYTIACGRDLVWLGAQTWEDALIEAQRTIVGDLDPGGCYRDIAYLHPESRLRRAILYKAEERILPIEDLYREADTINERVKQHKTEDAERTEYERLRIKFG